MTDEKAGPTGPAGSTGSAGPVVVVGPTASGKSALALAAARLAGRVELVSADSMQVYRGMDIGTAKPSASEQAEVRHHMIDLIEPEDEYTVSRFQADALSALGDIERRGMSPLLVGGTGLYVQAVIDGLAIPGRYPEARKEIEAEPDSELLYRRLFVLDPVAAARIEPTNRRRVIRALEVTVGSGKPFSSFGPGLGAYPPTGYRVVGLRWPRDTLNERIEARWHSMVEAGLVEEVRVLSGRPGNLSATASQALGYKELLAHLRGECSLDEAVDVAIRRTRQFARRQERWFRRDPRIEWFDVSSQAQVMALADPVARMVAPAMM